MDATPLNSLALLVMRRPTNAKGLIRMVIRSNECNEDVPMRPNKPIILPNTSTIRILTKRFGSAASAKAAVDPVMPTQTPHSKLHTPTVKPPPEESEAYTQCQRPEIGLGARLTHQ